MSDNKDFFENELIFEDEIDFDGLDDIPKEETEIAQDDNSSSDEEASDISPELVEETVEEVLQEVDINNIDCNESECESSFLPEETSYTEPLFSDSEIEIKDEETDEREKQQLSINRFCIINTAVSTVTLCAVAAGIAFGYNYLSSVEKDLEMKSAEIASLEKKNEILEEDYLEAISLIEQEEKIDTAADEFVETDKGKISFYDSSVGYSWTPVLAGIEQNDYSNENFILDNRGRLSYIKDGENSSYFGIDVSSYQGDIDWQLVKEDNVEFAFLRIGYRGYGEEGKLCADEKFANNYSSAHDVGIDLGVYFFSQAISVDEAVEEANYVLSLLDGKTLEYPIVFDWETVQTGDPEDIPRTDDVMPHTLTLSAIAFCETIRDAGYDAMIYTNKKLATIKYDLRQLKEYPIWLAYYDTELNYRYDFDIWQYGTGVIDGIDGEVDVNIAMIK